jgi:hypothetical protein
MESLLHSLVFLKHLPSPETFPVIDGHGVLGGSNPDLGRHPATYGLRRDKPIQSQGSNACFNGKGDRRRCCRTIRDVPKGCVETERSYAICPCFDNGWSVLASCVVYLGLYRLTAIGSAEALSLIEFIFWSDDVTESTEREQ